MNYSFFYGQYIDLKNKYDHNSIVSYKIDHHTIIYISLLITYIIFTLFIIYGTF